MEPTLTAPLISFEDARDCVDLAVEEHEKRLTGRERRQWRRNRARLEERPILKNFTTRRALEQFNAAVAAGEVELGEDPPIIAFLKYLLENPQILAREDTGTGPVSGFTNRTCPRIFSCKFSQLPFCWYHFSCC